MTLTRQQKRFVNDWMSEDLLQWCHPCGDDAYKYMDKKTYRKRALEYVENMTTSHEKMMEEWGGTFEELKVDFRATFNTEISDATIHYMFLDVLTRYCNGF